MMNNENKSDPVGFCFETKDFFRTMFSVDYFLQKNKYTPLEIIRDDLGMYLKQLRSAMIELINQDYIDFVSLSGNLIGLNLLITNISNPLISLRNDIQHIQHRFHENITQLQKCLTKKSNLCKLRKRIQYLKDVQTSYIQLTQLIQERTQQNIHDNYNESIYFERAATAITQLRYKLTDCDEYLTDNVKQQCSDLQKSFYEELQLYFIKVLNSNHDHDSIKSCLRIFIALNACNYAEKYFQEQIVSKYTENLMIKNDFQNPSNSNIISVMYNKILDFISLHMKDLLFITYYTDEIKGFHFLLNSFWLEVERLFANRLVMIYSSGNPNMFYQNYQATIEFMSRIEVMLKTKHEIKEFRQQTNTKLMQERWNLLVYYQIRFQEISTELESACEQTLKSFNMDQSLLDNKQQIQLIYLNSAYNCIQKCWSNGVYIQKLYPKHLKLTFQILSRVNQYTLDILEIISSNKHTILKSTNIDLLVACHQEYSKFINYYPEIKMIVFQKLPLELQSQKLHIENIFEEPKREIANDLKIIEKLITSQLIHASSQFISQVADVSRLYRKTNKDKPRKHCSYVQNMLNPIDNFIKKFTNKLDANIINEIIMECFISTTDIYYHAIEEALSSVQKTEKSLKRLKNVRGGNIDNESTNTNSNLDTNSIISDDDKIRLQLQVDVIYWTTEIENQNIHRSDIQRLSELNQLVQDAIRK